MKKALTTLALISGSISYTLAQTNINIGNTGQTAQQGQINGGALLQLLALAQTIANRLVPFAIGVAVLSFFWFLIQLIMKGGESGEKRGTAMKGMGMSILALFLMVSIWGVIGFLGSVTGVGQGGAVPTPTIPQPN